MKKDRLFSGFSFDKTGPHLILDDINSGKRERFYLQNLVCSIKALEERYCVGRYDLKTLKSYRCPRLMRLENEHKGNYCEECKKSTGFNPAFYNALNISPQQQEYNKQIHIVYLAYFAPGKIKVGIALKNRISIRLLEQGARAAVILQEFPNAYEARILEKNLSDVEGIRDNFKSSEKLKFLADYEYDFIEARVFLEETMHRLNLKPIRDAIDLSRYYFYGEDLKLSVNIPSGDNEDIICGKCLGMIGDVIIVEQQQKQFGISIKKMISHVVSISTDALDYAYSIPAKQISIFDFNL